MVVTASLSSPRRHFSPPSPADLGHLARCGFEHGGLQWGVHPGGGLRLWVALLPQPAHQLGHAQRPEVPPGRQAVAPGAPTRATARATPGPPGQAPRALPVLFRAAHNREPRPGGVRRAMVRVPNATPPEPTECDLGDAETASVVRRATASRAPSDRVTGAKSGSRMRLRTSGSAEVAP